MSTERVEPGDAITIEATVVDPSFVEINDAMVVAQVARPGGQTVNVPLQWTGQRDGQYRGTFVSTEQGAYEVSVDATRGGQAVGSGIAYVRAAPGDVEYFDPTMHPQPLRRIAEETGGKFYTAENVAGLAEDVRYAGRGVTSVEERELWNMELTEQGFYEIRSSKAEGEVGVVAANVDPAESDLTPIDPKEIAAAAVGDPSGAETAKGVPLTPEAQEKNQRLWWYLLCAGIVLLGADTLLSNRLAKA